MWSEGAVAGKNSCVLLLRKKATEGTALFLYQNNTYIDFAKIQ